MPRGRLYAFHDVVVRERAYSDTQLRAMLRAAGLRLAFGPNPARPGDIVFFRLAEERAATGSMEILDPEGRLVRRLTGPTGLYPATWDGRSDDGALVPSGVYFARWSDGRNTVGTRLSWVR